MTQSRTPAWLFPGQGSQYLGMGRELWSQAGAALDIVEEAEELSGLPLRELSLQGPEEELTRTDVLQPALTCVSLGGVELLRRAGFCPSMIAGHSLGEFPALCAAGVLTVSDCLKLVVERGRLMQQAARELNGGMGAVKRMSLLQLKDLLVDGICIANYNSPDQIVVSGPLAALNSLSAAVTADGGEYVPLAVAGPWHSESMSKAAQLFSKVIEEVEFAAPACPVFMNVSGRPEWDSARIKVLMKAQMTAPVLWQTSIAAMFESGASLFVEVGPGKVLRGLLRRILPDETMYRARGVEGKRSLDFLAREAA